MQPNSFLVFLLAVIGLLILFSELFMPSGMLGVIALCCFVASAYCAYETWYLTEHYVWWWSYVSGLLMIVPGVVIFGFYWLPRTRWGQSVFATPQKLAELEAFQDEGTRLTSLINQRGKALTMFSPGGMALIGREKFHAESEGILIESGDEVIVVGVRAHRLVVRPAGLYDSGKQGSDLVSDATPEAPREEERDPNVIDFDIPKDM